MSGMIASDDEARLRDASAWFYAAVNGIQRGEAAPMLAVWSHADDVSYCAPSGEIVRGWAELEAYWLRAAAANAASVHPLPSAEGEIVVASQAVSAEEIAVAIMGDLGYVVARETVRHADGSVVLVARATNLYRRAEGGFWHLVHRHADAAPQ